MYKKYILIFFIVGIILVILGEVKKTMLYHPIEANPDKYRRFYEKLVKDLTGSHELVENTILETDDNLQLDTVFVKNNSMDKCILFFHGNAGNISVRFDMIKFLYNFGSVVIFDYRAYGKSSGTMANLSCHGLQSDAMAVWNYATKKLGYKPNQIVLFGESLGCSIAIWLSSVQSRTLNSDNYPHSMILNSPFYSLSSMIEVTFDRVNLGIMGKFFTLLFGNEYRSDDWIKYTNFDMKIIIARSRWDELIPYTEGDNLFKLIQSTHPNVKLININGTHNNLQLTNEYIYGLSDMLEEKN